MVTTMKKTCKMCGKEFDGGAKRLYCSHQCAGLGLSAKVKCEICGLEFSGRPTQRVCSGKCMYRLKASRKRFTQSCQQCGIEFSSSKPRLFCGKSCSASSRINDEMRARSRASMNEVRLRPDVQEKLKRHLSSDMNPVKSADVRRKAIEAARLRGYAHLNGGNGRPATVPQKILADRLGWEMEVVVATGGKPHCYKIDIANRELMIGIEVDGHSHQKQSVKISDKKKEELLRSIGWTILRFKNKEVLQNLDMIVSTILKLVPATTSPGSC